MVQHFGSYIHLAPLLFMPVSIKPVLRNSKIRKDGTAPIWLRITADRKSRYVSTGITIEPKHWNKNRNQVRRSHRLYNKYNARLRELRLEAEEAALKENSAAAVKATLNGESGSFSQYFKGFIETRRDRDQYWERKKYTTTLNKVHGALGENLSWDDLTTQALTKIERYCREERNNNPNTTRKALSRVRRVVNQAVKEGELNPGNDPFLIYEMPKGVPPDRRWLSRDEITKLAKLELDPSTDLARDRDAFLLAFYGGGIRFGDVSRLRPSMISKRRLRYRMMKTDQLVSIPLPEPAHEIIEYWSDAHDEPYVFPYLERGDERDPVHLRKRIAVRNNLANHSLKELAEMANIKNPDGVTFHVARHSFADFARRTSGDVYAVSKALGHSNLNITERYLSSFDQDAVDGLADELWND